jgi:hypothetical protein
MQIQEQQAALASYVGAPTEIYLPPPIPTICRQRAWKLWLFGAMRRQNG